MVPRLGDKGVRYQKPLGPGSIKRQDARDLAVVERTKILKGEAGIDRKPTKRADIPFEQACKDWLECVEANNRWHTYRGYKGCVNELKKSFTGKQLSEITAWDVERHKMRRKAAPVRANREVAALKRLFNWAKGAKKFDGDNPVSNPNNPEARVKFFKESKGRVRFLDPQHETERLLVAAKDPLRTLLIVCSYTGVRTVAEALQLKWVDVDFRRNQITVLSAYAKNNKTRVVPLSPEAREALEHWKGTAPGKMAQSEYVFPKQDGQPYSRRWGVMCGPFKKARKAPGLLDVTAHALRHTFVSWATMSGMTPQALMENGGVV